MVAIADLVRQFGRSVGQRSRGRPLLGHCPKRRAFADLAVADCGKKSACLARQGAAQRRAAGSPATTERALCCPLRPIAPPWIPAQQRRKERSAQGAFVTPGNFAKSPKKGSQCDLAKKQHPGGVGGVRLVPVRWVSRSVLTQLTKARLIRCLSTVNRPPNANQRTTDRAPTEP